MRQTDNRNTIRLRTITALGLALLACGARSAGQTPWTAGCSGVPGNTVGSMKWSPTLCQEFNGPVGPPDTSAWAFDLGATGWGNNEVEIYCGPPGYPGNPSQCPASFSTSTSNSYVDGAGRLVIQVLKSGGNWTSARMKTEGVQNFQYGRIEASIKIPDTTNPGLWPAFWWLGSNIGTVPWPNCGEADIMENWSPSVLNGPGPAQNRSSVHTALTGGNGIAATYNFPSGRQADTGFYAYGVIWSANMIQIYLNPTTSPQPSLRPFFIVTTSDLPAGDTWPFNAGAFLLANVAVGGTMGGPTGNTPSPDAMTIDYVRQYTPSAVPAPVLGNPPSLTVTPGATVDNTSTFTPSLAAGTGYVYFSCTTTAPKASCSIKTDDPLNQFVVSSDANPPESVTVAVATTSNAWGLPHFFYMTGWPLLLIFALAMLLRLPVFAPKWRAGLSLRYAIVLAGAVLAATAIISCGGRGPAGGGGGAGSTGTPPGNYSVTVYAFTEANASTAGNSHVDASVTIPLTVN